MELVLSCCNCVASSLEKVNFSALDGPVSVGIRKPWAPALTETTMSRAIMTTLTTLTMRRTATMPWAMPRWALTLAIPGISLSRFCVPAMRPTSFR